MVSENLVSRILLPPSKEEGRDHSSGSRVTPILKQPTRRCRRHEGASETGGAHTTSLFGLAPHGVFLASNRHRSSGALLPHRFTLTGVPKDAGGLLSVALSVASPRLAVSEHAARGSSDFPRRPKPPRSRPVLRHHSVLYLLAEVAGTDRVVVLFRSLRSADGEAARCRARALATCEEASQASEQSAFGNARRAAVEAADRGMSFHRLRLAAEGGAVVELRLSRFA